MKIVDAGPGNLPDILTYSGKYETLPALWKPFSSAWFAVPMAILLPMAIAAVLGAAIFRQRIRGAYFAILSQALAGAFVIVIVGNLSLTGGTNGLTNFQSFFGLSVVDAGDQRILYYFVAALLLLVFLMARALVLGRYGRLLIASRTTRTGCASSATTRPGSSSSPTCWRPAWRASPGRCWSS